MNEPVTMIATMGGQPQIVTFALDSLLEKGHNITEVEVLYVERSGTPKYEKAMARLMAEFRGGTYQYRDIPIKFTKNQLPINDIRSDKDVSLVAQYISQIITVHKAQGKSLHVVVSGGRRMLALMTLSAALLQFERHDALWHMYTAQEIQDEAEVGAIMHLNDAQIRFGFQLIKVPIVPLAAVFPAIKQMFSKPLPTDSHPAELAEHHLACQTVYDSLTPRPRKVLKLIAEGKSPKDIETDMHINKKTVSSHLGRISDECEIVWLERPKNYWEVKEKFKGYFDS